MASVFSKILNGEIKGTILYQDDLCAVFKDINPQAPTHLLIVPKKEIQSAGAAQPEDQMVLGHLILTAGRMAREHAISESGYRLVMNVGDDGGMTVPHLHLHLIGGRPMNWPPG